MVIVLGLLGQNIVKGDVATEVCSLSSCSNKSETLSFGLPGQWPLVYDIQRFYGWKAKSILKQIPNSQIVKWQSLPKCETFSMPNFCKLSLMQRARGDPQWFGAGTIQPKPSKIGLLIWRIELKIINLGCINIPWTTNHFIHCLLWKPNI